MTSNIGADIIQENFDKEKDVNIASEKAKMGVLELLRASIRPEFLNRIDDILMFTPLSRNDIKQIVQLQIDLLKKTVSDQSITIDATEEAIAFLAEKGYDPQYGARPVKRVIQKEVLNNLSKEILAGTIKTDSIVLIDCFDDTLVFRNTN